MEEQYARQYRMFAATARKALETAQWASRELDELPTKGHGVERRRLNQALEALRGLETWTGMRKDALPPAPPPWPRNLPIATRIEIAVHDLNATGHTRSANGEQMCRDICADLGIDFNLMTADTDLKKWLADHPDDATGVFGQPERF